MRLTGAVFAAVFWMTVLVVGGMTSDYSHVQQPVSALGALGSPHAGWMNWMGIIPFALSMVVTGGFLISDHRPALSAWAGGVMLVLGGAAFAVAGLNPCDVGCRPSELPSAVLHQDAAGMGFLLLPLAAIAHGTGVLRAGPRRSIHGFSLACGLCMIASLVVAFTAFGPADGLMGLLQRVTLLFISLWVAGLSFVLYAGRREQARPPAH